MRSYEIRMPHALTPRLPIGSSFFVCAAILGGCGVSAVPTSPADDSAETRIADTHTVTEASGDTPTPSTPKASPETTLGVTDTGIWSDLDDQIQLAFPSDANPDQVTAVVDREHKLLIAYIDGWPTKVYPLAGDSEIAVGDQTVALRAGDAAELGPLLSAGDVTELAKGSSAPPGDADGDGIPDPLDLLIGAQKTVLNGADYGAGYIHLAYPNGDVPRDRGVCTDVVVRAVRNAGTDIQSALQDDIKRSRRSYPMVKKRNAHIDHRRVKTLLPYFRRHWEARSADLDDPTDPLMPGDVVFMDTFPSRSGPDHIGIISNHMAESGQPLVINNWTNGTKTAEMDLLGWVPVTHRFRYPSN